MNQATPWLFTLPYLGCVVLTILLALVVAGHRFRSSAARPFLTWVLAELGLSLGYLAELRAPDLESKLFFDNLQWLPLPVLVAAMVAFAYEYTGASAQARRWGRVALLSVAASVLAIELFAFAGNLRESARIEYAGVVPALIYDFTAWDYLATLAIYGWIVAAAVRLWRGRSAQVKGHRKQITLVLAGFLLPAAFTLLAFSELRLFGQRDIGPIAFAFGSLFVFWGIHRHRLFNIVPIARVAVLEAIPDPVIVFDSSRRIVDANAAALAFADGHELVGKLLSDALPRSLELSAAAESQGPSLIRASDRVLVMTLVPVPDEQARQVASAIVLRDVTDVERLNAELERRVWQRTEELLQIAENLRASQEKLQAVFNGTNTMIGLLDVEGRVVAVNRTALSMAGVEAASVLNRPFAQAPWWAHDPAQRAKLERALERARAGETVHFATTHAAKNAEQLRAIDFVLTPYRDDAGRVIWLIAEGRDVTELEVSEREKANLARRLQHGERLESLGRLAGGVAHDFNNLLMVIAGNAELLAGDLKHDRAALDLLREIQKASSSATTLTRQLLAFSKERSQEDETLEIDTQLASLSELLKRLIGGGIELELEFGAAGSAARIAGGKYEQIVINLVVNAKQALDGRGKVRVSTFTRRHEHTPVDAIGPLPAPGTYVVTRVSDDGPGIDPALVERVFEPFFTTKEGGTGLGLATVYALTTRAGGLVCLRSAPRSGTTIEIHLPEVKAEAAARKSERASASCAGLRVLMVDDNALVRTALGRALERLGCKVTTADGPDAACRLFEQGVELDALVTDISMPGMSGNELAQHAVTRLPGLPVLFISANPPNEETQLWLDRGLARFLQKPVPLDALREALTAVVAARRESSA